MTYFKQITATCVVILTLLCSTYKTRPDRTKFKPKQEISTFKTWPTQSIANLSQNCKMFTKHDNTQNLFTFLNSRPFLGKMNKIKVAAESSLHVCIPPKSGSTSWAWMLGAIEKKRPVIELKKLTKDPFEFVPYLRAYAIGF